MRHSRLGLLTLLLAGVSAASGLSADRAGKGVAIDSVYLRLIDTVDVPALSAGVVDEIARHEGARVSRGNPLVRLDAADAELALERAKLDLEAADESAEGESKLQQARAAVDEARSMQERARFENDIAKKKGTNDVSVRAALKSEAVATSELKRAQAARREVRDSVSDNELDHLQLTADKATLEVEQARHDLAVADLTARMKGAEEAGLAALVKRRQAELLQAEEDRRVAKIAQRAKANAVRTAERELTRRTVRAPVAGEVVSNYRQVGEWVEPGERVLRLVRLDRLRAEGFLPAADGGRELMGTAVKFVVTIDGKSREFAGRVSFVSPEIDPVNEQVLVWAEIENPEPGFPLRPGLRGKLVMSAK